MTAVSVQQIQQQLTMELSRRARTGHILLLLVSLAIAIVVASLLFTEPALPFRAQAAFAVMLVIALSWAVFAWWTITRRQVRLAGHEIVAGRMAVIFCATFVVGSIVLVWAGPSAPAALMSAVLGCLLLLAASLMLLRARRRFADLLRRRGELEQAIQELKGERS